MKRHNVILTMLFAAFFAKGAQANTNATEVISPADSHENANLDEVQALLERLTDAHALEVDDNGNVRVKQSIVDKLKRDGRLQMQTASFGSICN